MCFTDIFLYFVTYSGIPILCTLDHLVLSHCSWILCSLAFSPLYVSIWIISVHLSSSLLILLLAVSLLLNSLTKELISNVLFLSIAAILVILPTVFIADLFCESCTLMFCFMSKSKVFKEILVLFNVVMEPAGNTKQWLYSRLDPGGQVHFVTYAINSQLYIFGICYFGVEMRFQFLYHKKGSQWSDILARAYGKRTKT